MGRYSIQTLRGGCGSRSVGGKDLVEINEEGGRGGRGVGARKVEG